MHTTLTYSPYENVSYLFMPYFLSSLPERPYLPVLPLHLLKLSSLKMQPEFQLLHEVTSYYSNSELPIFSAFRYQ